MAGGERSRSGIVLVGRHRGHKTIDSQFTREDAAAVVHLVLGIFPWKRRRLALDVHYAARHFEESVP